MHLATGRSLYPTAPVFSESLNLENLMMKRNLKQMLLLHPVTRVVLLTLALATFLSFNAVWAQELVDFECTGVEMVVISDGSTHYESRPVINAELDYGACSTTSTLCAVADECEKFCSIDTGAQCDKRQDCVPTGTCSVSLAGCYEDSDCDKECSIDNSACNVDGDCDPGQTCEPIETCNGAPTCDSVQTCDAVPEYDLAYSAEKTGGFTENVDVHTYKVSKVCEGPGCSGNCAVDVIEGGEVVAGRGGVCIERGGKCFCRAVVPVWNTSLLDLAAGNAVDMTLDPLNAIPEADEGNNTAQGTLSGVPIPGLTPWGVMVILLAVMVAAAFLIRRRRVNASVG